MWQRNAEGVVELFTEQGSINLLGPGQPVSQGRASLLEGYKGAFRGLAPRPFIHNHVVELLGPDRARGTCYAEIHGVQDVESMIGAAVAQDEYEKVGGEWKFRSRDVAVHYMVPLREGWAAALGDSA